MAHLLVSPVHTPRTVVSLPIRPYPFCRSSLTASQGCLNKMVDRVAETRVRSPRSRSLSFGLQMSVFSLIFLLIWFLLCVQVCSVRSRPCLLPSLSPPFLLSLSFPLPFLLPPSFFLPFCKVTSQIGRRARPRGLPPSGSF